MAEYSVTCILFSPDRKFMAIGVENNVDVWSCSTGEHLYTLSGHAETVFHIRYSPDGQYIASTSKDNTVRVWDCLTRSGKHVLRGHTEWIRGVDYSPDGKYLASCSVDKTIRVWNAETGRVHTVLHTRSHMGGVMYLPNGDIVSFGTDPAEAVCIWKTCTNTSERIHFPNAIWHSDRSPDGEHIVTADSGGQVHVWNLREKKPILVLTGHRSEIRDVRYSPDGRHITTIDNMIRVWDARTGQCIFTHSMDKKSIWDRPFLICYDAYCIQKNRDEYGRPLYVDITLKDIPYFAPDTILSGFLYRRSGGKLSDPRIWANIRKWTGF